MALQVNPYQAYSIYRNSFISPQTATNRYSNKNWLQPNVNSWSAFGTKAQMTSAQNYLTEVRKGADTLKKATSALTRSDVQQWNKVAKVAGESVTSVNASKAIASRLSEQKITVTQMSTAQANQGKLMTSDAKALQKGAYDYTLRVGDKEKQLRVQIEDTDTNLDIQNKTAAAISSSGLSVNASVETNKADGTSRIVIEGKDRGVAGAPNTANPQTRVFSLRDDGGEAGLIAALGADDVARYAQNAVYSVDGGAPRVAVGDEVVLNNSVRMTLQSTGDSVISYENDYSGIAQQAKDFVDSFNSMVKLGADNASLGGSYLASELANLSKTHSRTLASVGISVQNNGSLSINADKLGKSAADGSLKSLFTGTINANYGFAGKVSSAITKISSNPMRYYQISPQTTPAATSNMFFQSMMYGSASGFYTGLLFDAYL